MIHDIRVQRHGHSPYNHIFDITSCDFKNGQADMKMTSVVG